MKEITVSVGADHIAALAKARKPILAIAELIWNALDADAKVVRVTITPNELHGIELIQVADNGTGITFSELDLAFGQLGDSWKKLATKTRELGRALHGKRGIGRYRSFALGGKVVWETRYLKDGTVHEYTINFDTEDYRRVFASDPSTSDKVPGTTVTIYSPSPKFETLGIESTKIDITEHFAIYLQRYPDIELVYDGSTIKPSELIELSTDIPFEYVTEDGVSEPQVLTVIEWKSYVDRALFLCNEDGFSYREMLPGIQAPGLQFTAYLRSRLVQQLAERDSIDIELGDLGKLLNLTKEKLRVYNAKRQLEQASALVNEWKQEDIYPYEGSTDDPVKQTEQRVFDVVAASVSKYLPDFKSSKKKTKNSLLIFCGMLLKQVLLPLGKSLRK